MTHGVATDGVETNGGAYIHRVVTHRGATRLLMTALLMAALCAVLVGCTGTSNGSDAGPSVSTSIDGLGTTTAAPILLALAPNLGLSPEQCFADLPPSGPPTTTTLPGAGGAAPETEPTAPDTLPETTAIPQPAVVAVVDCAGSNLGQVYATFCLGDNEDDPGQLTAVACPGDPELDYPGDRNIRRSAARVCLQRFEETFGESYAASARVAQEFTPTEGVWDLGDHRVVCHSVEP